MLDLPAHEELVAELAELIAIPSLSADPAHADDLVRAADWVAARIRRAGGEAAIETRNGRPLVVGEVRASTGADAPTVLVYAHLDVQPADPLELWDSEPFTLVERDGHLVARGVADDKLHAFLLVRATELLAAAGELGVHVRFLFDSEEEVGGHSVVDWLREDPRGADVALILDGGYATDVHPGFCTALRGLCYLHLTVRTGERDLHSGMYGGAALNALHALVQTLGSVLAGPDGLIPDPLRAGIIPPSAAELEGWRELRTGEDELGSAGARPMDPAAEEEFWIRTTSEPTVEVNGIAGGSPHLQKTVLPVEAQANISLRLAPGQDPDVAAATVERLLRESCPPGADLTVDLWSKGHPAWFDPSSDAIRLAQDAFESILDTRPLLVRTGGTIPIAAALGARSIPVVVTGFVRPGANIHSPNENVPVAALDEGLRTTIETFRRFAELG